MADQTKSPGRKPASYFSQSEQRDKLWRAEAEKERADSLAKTAKLRALRLAKEAAEAEAQKNAVADGTAPEPKANRSAGWRKREMKS